MEWFLQISSTQNNILESHENYSGVGWGAVIYSNPGWGPHLLYYLRTVSINFPFLYKGANGIIFKIITITTDEFKGF